MTHYKCHFDTNCIEFIRGHYYYVTVFVVVHMLQAKHVLFFLIDDDVAI